MCRVRRSVDPESYLCFPPSSANTASIAFVSRHSLLCVNSVSPNISPNPRQTIISPCWQLVFDQPRKYHQILGHTSQHLLHTLPIVPISPIPTTTLCQIFSLAPNSRDCPHNTHAST